MVSIILDESKYIESYSKKYRTPKSIVVDSIPDESDPEKLKCYQYIKKKFVFDADKWAAIEAERAAIEAEREENARIESVKNEINELKEMLEATDYQIIKCYEYSLNQLEMPYDIAQLHAERQPLRDRIEELEKHYKKA